MASGLGKCVSEFVCKNRHATPNSIVSNATILYNHFMNEEQTPAAAAESPKYGWKQIVKEIVIFAVIAVCIVLPFRVFIAEPYVVSGASMSPTFETGHYLIVDKISYKLGEEPPRNSVVIFTFPQGTDYPSEEGKDLIKRVIGLPGDTVTEVGNAVTITNAQNQNGFTVDQSYVVHPLPENFSVTLKAGQYFVMGDNRAESFDSRSWGVLPASDIIGRPVLRLWPVSEIGILPGNDTK